MPANAKRWLIVAMGTLLQLCLGSVYAWSYFQQPLMEACGWTNTQVAWAFSLAIACLGLSAAAGGVLLARVGPRILAVSGILLYMTGYLLAGLALHWKSLPLLWCGFGVVGGIGLGLGYVTPVATVAKWFPDKRGLATGMVVMGFGFGALLMSKVIAPGFSALLNGSLPLVLAASGLLIGVTGVIASLFLANPPDAVSGREVSGRQESTSRAEGASLWSRQFLVMWLMFFCNIAAGIAIIGFQSPLLQDLLRAGTPALEPGKLAAYGATLIAVSSVFNGIGRLFWGAISDRIGPLQAFRLMLVTQVGVFAGLIFVTAPWVFGILICYVLLCYGGGFGVMPSYVVHTFGQKTMPVVYGCMLTAWSAAGIAGPQVVARLKDHFGSAAAAYTFGTGAVLLVLGSLLSLAFSSRALRTGQRA